MEDFKNVLKNQQEILTAMEQLWINFKKDSPDRKTADYVKRRLETLDMYWSEFQLNHEKLSRYGNDDNDYFTGNHYEKTQSFYMEKRGIIQQSTKQLLKPATPLQIQSPGPSHASRTFDLPSKIETNERENNNKLEDKIRKQNSNFRAFNRTLTNINLSSISEKWEYEDVLKTLDARWKAIDTLHWEIDSNCNDENETYEQEFTSNETKYQEMKKQVNSLLWNASHREKMTPHLDIPEFFGSYQQWTSFKDLFTEAIHCNPSLSNAQKMQFLKSKIRGEPERLIQHLPISSDNYNTCWEILNHRYNNKKLIFSTHMNTIMNLPVLQQATSNQVKRIHDVTTECLNGIKNLGVNIDTWDPMLVHILSQKLDSETHNDYMSSLKQPRELPTLKEFLEFLESKFTTLESSRRKQETSQKYNSAVNSNNSGPQKHQAYKSSYYNRPSTSKFQQGKKIICPVCNGDHGIYYCTKFREMDPSYQRKTINNLKFCSNCLYSHEGKSCQSNKRCKECHGYHNTILHQAFTNNAVTSNNVTNVARPCIPPAEILLATALVKVEGADGSQHTLHALIDQGSQVSLITERAAQRLQLSRQKCNGVITGVGSNNTMCKGIINITCSALSGSYTFKTDVFIMKNITNNLPNKTLSKPSWEFLDKIELADPRFYQSKPIDLLLGAEIYANIILDRIEREDQTRVVAQETRLGWILCGKVQSLHCNIIINNIEDIQKFWEIEDISENSIYSTEEEECMKFYKSTTTRLQDGKYQVRLPLKTNVVNELGQSKRKAIAQFQQLERKFCKNKIMAMAYKEFIHEYIKLGHMKLAYSNHNSRECLLPHHCVQREDSTTTKLRVVFNASAKTSNGTSLNDFMYKGPNLQKDLLELIIQWRQYRFAFIADIEKMFRQLWVHPDDQPLQKIIWRDSPQEQLREYQLTTVTYGTKAAPFLAMMTLRRLAADERQTFPEAARVVESSMYMDDLLHGSHRIESAKQIKQDLISLFKSGGFNLRKWRSNHAALSEDADKGDRQGTEYSFKQVESTKTLGLSWNPEQDVFCFNKKTDDNAGPPYTTKRMLLSEISKLFDPAGWLTPISTQLKLIFQRIWNEKLDWDDKIPKIIETDWKKINQEFQHLNSFKIPRWLETGPDTSIELHGFCDASQKAYACVIYCKTMTDGNTKIILIAGKSRLVPNNKTNISLPRLELSGAVLLSKLMEKVKNSLSRYNIKMFGWVDSTAVLGWIQGCPERWKIFVANRVRKITKIMPAECWRYVKSADNPADCASRGLTPSQLREHALWWKGPTWLPDYKAEGTTLNTYLTEEESRQGKVHVAQFSVQPDSIIEKLLYKYSSFPKAVRVLAWVRRFITKKQDRNQESYITVKEFKAAATLIIKHTQAREYSLEISQIKEKEIVSSKSKIMNLSPYLDENDILRVGGRLEQANIDPEMKHPAILPTNHRLTDLIITWAHEMTYHGGARITLSFIRQKYWIVSGNNATKKIIRRCVTCRKQNPVKHHQLMGDLPAARINPSRPFTHTGVDFSGHVFVKANKGRGIKTTKAYVAVFVCMATKAVHLELVSDMTTSSFIAAIRRMSARRGKPSHVYSDNGRNFLGASRILQQEYQEILQVMGDEFKAEIADMHITWHFNAPAWPSAGGLWEAAVKSFKFHLKRVIGEQKLTFEEFTTLLSQIEACLNSRPLCPLSEDPNDLNCLTPAHFLTGGPTLTLIETEHDQRTRWHLTQKIMRDLWKRWRSEYLIQLAARSKWHHPQRNININDVVIIHDDNLPPGKWAMGRVVELHQGKDGLVRVVTLKTKSGTIKRPIVKVSRLLENQGQIKSKDKQDIGQTCDSKLPRSRKTTTSPNKLGLVSMVTTLMLFMTTLTHAQDTVNITQFRNNQHLYFDKISNMMLIRDEWKVIVYYDTQPYWQGITVLSDYLQTLKTTCETIRQQGHCDTVLLQLRHGYSELEYYNHMLLSQHNSSLPVTPRRRRGLINGIGYVANSLFGVLDERFAEQYKKDIDRVREDQQHTASLWKKQTSVIEAEYNVLKRMEVNMNQQHKLVNRHINQLEQAWKKLREQVQDVDILNSFEIGAIIASNLFNSLKDMQITILDTVTDIYHGRFNFHLLPPEQLIRELSVISTKLPKDVTLPIDNVHTELRKIYELLRVKTRVLADVLIFEIKLPLISRDTFEILKVWPIPKTSQGRSLSVVPVSEYISINMKKDVYLEMSENDLRTCLLLSDVYYCHANKPEFRIKNDDSFCEKQDSQCKTVMTSCKDVWNEVNNLNTYLYVCCTECNIKTICDYQVTARQLTGAGLIHVGFDCIIKTDEFTIVPRKPHTTELKTDPGIYAPHVAPINHIVNITLPTMTSFNASQQQDISELGLKIQELKDADFSTERISYHDIHHYTMIYVVLSVLMVIGIVITARRVQCRWRVPSIAVVEESPSAQQTPALATTPAPASLPRAPPGTSRPHRDRHTSPRYGRIFISSN